MKNKNTTAPLDNHGPLFVKIMRMGFYSACFAFLCFLSIFVSITTGFLSQSLAWTLPGALAAVLTGYLTSAAFNEKTRLMKEISGE